MVQIAFLLAAAVLLILMQQLRAMLAYVFAQVHARALPPGTAAPAATADLFAAAHEELSALGFEGPQWFLRDSDCALDSASFRVAAFYRHPQSHAVLCLGAMPVFDAADKLNAYVVTRLTDGTHAVTQAYDPYFAVVASMLPELRAQAVAPASLLLLYQAHVAFVIDGGKAADPAFAAAYSFPDLTADWYNGLRDALLARRCLRRDRDGQVRARWLFALRMLLGVWRRPRLKAKPQPIDSARIGLLASAVERVREKAPPARTQWLLFGVSVFLFALIGAVVWDPRFAILLLGVIGLHELGHYVAMRAFGYRNVHMLALPLIGGVTIGRETTPSAARRAWMSLMGPLPGILLGWALLLYDGPLGAEGWFGSWRLETAILLLAVNYINLLPIPPLDGGRVIQAMLPPRWHRVQAGFIAVACIGGGVAALWAGMTVIAMLALLQLNGLPQLLQNGRVLKALLADGPLPPGLRQLRLRRVLDVFERVAGKALAPKRRIAQAEAVLHSAEQPPMGWLQRILLTGVLLIVFVAPAGMALMFWQALPGKSARADTAQLAERLQRDERELEERMRALSLVQLAADLDTGTRSPSGASDTELLAAQTRLGRALPGELADVLRVRNGIPAIGLGPASQIGPAERKQLQADTESAALEVWMEDASRHEHVALERALHWVRLNDADPSEGDALLLYDDAEAPAVPGHRVIVLSEGEGRAYAGLRALIEESWMARQEGLRASERIETARRAARERLRDASTQQLLAEFPQPSMLARLLLRTAAARSPATPAQIEATERRIGSAMPAELAALYRQHDGMHTPALLPLAQVHRYTYDAETEKTLALWLVNSDFTRFDADWHATPESEVKAADLDGCLAFGGPWSAEPLRVGATEYWCVPGNALPERWISLRMHTIYPSLHAWLVDQAAHGAAMH